MTIQAAPLQVPRLRHPRRPGRRYDGQRPRDRRAATTSSPCRHDEDCPATAPAPTRSRSARPRACAFEPVWDVGPWNTKDDYWNPSATREMWKDLPQGKPEAQAAYQNGYNGGKDQFGRTVANPAGIDLADGVFWDALTADGQRVGRRDLPVDRRRRPRHGVDLVRLPEHPERGELVRRGRRHGGQVGAGDGRVPDDRRRASPARRAPATSGSASTPACTSRRRGSRPAPSAPAEPRTPSPQRRPHAQRACGRCFGSGVSSRG